MDEIVLLGATEADIGAVVAGVTADCKGNTVLHYSETDIVLPESSRATSRPIGSCAAKDSTRNK